MSDYKYPDDLIKKTDARIKAQLLGNGDDRLNLTIKRQGLAHMSAHTDYSIECKATTSQQVGRATNGKIVDGAALQDEIQKFTQTFKSDKSTSSFVKKAIESMSANGFGANKAPIQLANKGEKFICYQQCGSCAGKGQSDCRQCQGQTRQKCPMCHYMGELDCMTCQGRGMMDFNGQQKPCSYCQGRGRVYCTNCNGQKTIPCQLCQAKGHIPCKTCGAKGESSLITTIIPVAMTTSKINVQELDAEPKILVSKVGALNLAKGGHIDIKIAQPPQPENDTNDNAWYEDEQQTIKTTTGVYYNAIIPWAVGEIIYKNKPYNISLIGKKGAVADSAPFMDAILKKPLNTITGAASGGALVAPALRDACEYRVSRETLESVIRGQTKQAMVELQRAYGVGLSKKFIQKFVKATYTATKKITRRPRYVGLGVGLAISTAFFYYWFMMDGRTNTNGHDNNIRYAIDGLVLIIGMGITYGVIKAAAYGAMQTVLKSLNIKIKKIPTAGTAGIYGIGGCAIIWGGLFAMQFI